MVDSEAHRTLAELLGKTVVAAPTLLVGVLGVSSLLGKPLSERVIGRVVQTAVVTGLLAAVAQLLLMLTDKTFFVPIELGNWVDIHGVGINGEPIEYHFSVKFVFDRLSVPFAILTFVLCGTIGAFATRYLHREKGFNRFFMLYAVFMLGMIVTSLAGTIETLFAGWELVGLSSALLVAFFQERPAPARNGLHVWSVYRVSDAALLTVALILHHMRGHGDFAAIAGADPWPFGQAALTQGQAFTVGLLLLIAASAKSALVPFSNWLPRAMEGPTPSSAVFYGALSVHLGAFLLLRVSPVLELSTPLCVLVVLIGLCTAAYAAFAARVQTDIKSALSFASLTQVGIIVAEIGCGLRYIALVHILGHACLRTLQFLRAPTILYDYRIMENAIGDYLPHSSGRLAQRVPFSMRTWLYRLALERGYFDAWMKKYLVQPFIRVFRWCDTAERCWTDFLSRGRSRESDQLQHTTRVADDLL